MIEVSALVFDVFGTAVDWRTGIAAVASRHGLPGERFADAWRARYAPSMDLVRRGELEWMNLDALHRRSPDELLQEFGLRSRYLLATLSNGGVALLTNLAKQAGLRFDCILSAELVRHYKPDPEVYLMAAELLTLEPSQVGMVAAHRNDLRAAQGCGLKAVFVERRLEFGAGGEPDRLPDPDSDVEAGDFLDLAERLGC